MSMLGFQGKAEQGYYHFLYENLYQYVNVDLAKTHAPDGMALEPGIGGGAI